MTNISEKTTGSCKDREYIVTEVCPHCEAEVEMRWNVAADGYKAFCPHCGKRLMLCDACQHPEDKCVENCDYLPSQSACTGAEGRRCLYLWLWNGECFPCHGQNRRAAASF